MRILPVEAVPLAFRHPLQPREPAAGFAARLAALNGRSLPEFLREMSISSRGLDVAEKSAIRQIAFLGSAEADRLVRYTPLRKGEKFYTVAGEVFLRKSIKRTYFSYCASCLTEDLDAFEGPLAARPWLRVEWMLTHMKSCPRHRTFLCEARPERMPFAHFDFNEMIRQVVPRLAVEASMAAEADASPFQDWLLARLQGVRRETNWLDGVPMYAAVAFCEALGVSSLHPPKVRTAKLTETDWAAAADEGYRIAYAGAEGLHALLSRLNRGQAATRGFWGPRDTYGYAYGLLQRTLADPAYEKFRNAVRSFAVETMPIEPGTDVLGVVAGERKIHTVRTAAKDSGLHALTVRRLFNRMGVEEAADASGKMDHRIVVKADDLAAIIAELRNALSSPAVEKHLGIPKDHLKQLVSDGHLKALAKSDRRYGKRRFSLSDIEAFRRRWFDGAVEVAAASGRQVDIAEARRVSTCSISRLIEIVLSGKLKWKGRLAGRDDYMAIVVDADEVTRIVRSDASRSNLTKEEAERFLLVTRGPTVNALIRVGHLTVLEEFSPDARRNIPVVSRPSAETFRQRHVSLVELCQRTGLHHKQVRSQLSMSGIYPVLPEAEVGAFFYDRTSVANMEQENPDAWTFDKIAARKFFRSRARAHLKVATNL